MRALAVRGTWLRCSAVVTALSAVTALAALVHSARDNTHEGVVLASTWSIANMLATQQPATAGKKGPEIPDPHPDPE